MLCCTWKIGSPSLVDAHGLHSFACKRAPGRSARHHALNDLIAWEFASAGIPAMREPQCLSHSDGKRPDGLTLIPWQAGNFSCNMGCHGRLPVSRFLHSYGGAWRIAVVELAAARKTAKYAALESHYIFQPIVVKTLGPINNSAVLFLSGLGRRIAEVSGESHEGSFLFQRLSMLIQRFNAVLLHDCFVDEVSGHSS